MNIWGTGMGMMAAFIKSGYMRNVLLKKKFIVGTGFCLLQQSSNNKNFKNGTDTIPVHLPASFMNHYGIKYAINDFTGLQQPSAKNHNLRWNQDQQYTITKNDSGNSSDKDLFMRINYVKFSGMDPYILGFCLSVYNASSDSLAEFVLNKTYRSNPRKGCSNFIFSQMKFVQ